MTKTKTKKTKLKDPAMLFYPSDFMMEISYMTNEEAGKYIRVLCNIFFHGRLSIDKIKRICGEEFETILDMLSRDDKGCYYHERMEYEMLKRQQFCESRSKNASAKSKKEDSEVKTSDTEEQKAEKPKAEEKKAEEKKIYGREQNILLTDGEYDALKKELGDRLEKRIEDISLYIKKFGKKYESHYALILSWKELDNSASGRNNITINGDYSDIASLASLDMELSTELGGGFVRKMKNTGCAT